MGIDNGEIKSIHMMGSIETDMKRYALRSNPVAALDY